MIKASVFFALFLAAACNDADADADDSRMGVPPKETTAGEITDTSFAGVTAFLDEGRYKTWTADPAVHDDLGPHGKVRNFFNAVALTSVRAKAAEHPVGAIIVKELYKADGVTLKGHALEAKTKAGASGDTWLFYERLGASDPNPYYGMGHPTCTGCHGSGIDFVRAEAPVVP